MECEAAKMECEAVKMECGAVNKVLKIAGENPRVLLSPAFYAKICARLNIDTEQDNDRMVFCYRQRGAEAVIINSENCTQYKCIVQEGKNGIRIHEFIKTLVDLLTNEKIPPSPYEKMGQTAAYYCTEGGKILQKSFCSANNDK